MIDIIPNACSGRENPEWPGEWVRRKGGDVELRPEQEAKGLKSSVPSSIAGNNWYPQVYFLAENLMQVHF